MRNHLSENDMLRELWDTEQIREVIARYCRAIDRAMVDDAKRVYFEDATEDHGVYRGLAQEFVSFLTGLLTDEYIGHHCLGQTLIDLEGDTARCETYFVCGMAWNQPGSALEFADVRGRYIDTMDRRNGEWRIESRVAVLDITQQRSMDPEWDIAAEFIRGRRYPDDLVFHPDELRARVDLTAPRPADRPAARKAQDKCLN